MKRESLLCCRSRFTEHKSRERAIYSQFDVTSDMNPALISVKESRGPDLVYICAPLRGNVEANIDKATEYAREVFLRGDLPICPHIYFPQFASVDNPQEDRAAMDMGLALLRRCQRINVYSGSPTSGMREEIAKAKEWGIKIQPMRGKEKPRPNRVDCARQG